MKTLAVTLADFEGVPHGSTLAHTKVKVEARYSSDLTLTDGRIIPAAVKVKELPSTGERTFEVWASDDPAVAASSRGFAVIVTATITPTRGGGGARVQRTVKPLMSMDDVIHLGTLSPAEPVPPQWVTVDDMLDDVEASRAAAEAAVEAVGPAAQAAAAPAVAAARAAKADAAQSAADAQTALQAKFLTQDEGVATLLETAAGPKTRAALDGSTPPTYAVRAVPHTGMMDDFQRDPHGWVIQGSSTAGTTVTRDATQSIAPGGASVKFSVPAGGTSVVRLAYSPTLDFTDKIPVLWVRSDDWAALSENLIYFTSNNHAGNYVSGFSRAADTNRLIKDNEWFPITLPWSYLLSGTVNVAAINSIQIRLVAAAGKTPNFWLGGLGSVERQGRGVVTLTYDDAYRDNYTRALPIAAKYGFPGTVGVIADRIGTPSGLTVEMMREMEAVHGWEMVPHAYTVANHDASYANLSTEAAVADALAIRRWMIDHGFTRGQDDFIYPRGGFTPEVLTALRKVFASGRAVNGGRQFPGHETLPPADPHRTRCYMISNTETPAQIKAEIDKAIAGNSWLQLMFHSIVPDGTATAPTQYEVSKYEEILAYLHAKGVEVRTMSDALRHNPRDKPLVTQDLSGNVQLKNPTPAVKGEVALYNNPAGLGALVMGGVQIATWTSKGLQMRGNAIELGQQNSSPGIYHVPSGSPEGVVAAWTGSICLSGSAATGPAVWVKRTGTGTTGWFAYGAPLGAAAADFQNAAHSINTQGKSLGVMAWDYGTAKPLFARGSTPTSGWQDAMGTVIYTPA